jgi:indolepyruvate ferredoxin oxidoreductase alpha subunit
VAHAAILCPSFFRAEIVQNPNVWDRMLARFRGSVIGWMQGREARTRG